MTVVRWLVIGPTYPSGSITSHSGVYGHLEFLVLV